MKGDEVVYETLRKHGTDAEAMRYLRCCGTNDPELLEILREADAEEIWKNARRLLARFAVDEAMEKARQRKATLDSIAESPVLKDPEFWK